jgi:hypothetical protein
LTGADPLVIGVLGDYGSAAKGGVYYSNELAVANLIKSWNPDFIITTGDNNYPDGEAANIDTNIGQFFREYIYPYVGTFGAGATSNRFFPSIGNHDWSFGVSFLQPYLDYFSLPGNERYYSHRHGPVELFALSSDQQEPDGATSGSVQSLWLSNALAVSTAPWRLVYSHRTPYSSGVLHGTQTRDSAHMAWPYREWGATLVLGGHDHVYERIFTNGLAYFVIGLGGDRIDNFYSVPTAGSQVRYRALHGAMRIDVTETNLLCRFYNITNQLIDSYSLEIAPARLSLSVAASQVQIELAGTPGRSYVTESSEHLLAWTALSTNQMSSAGTATFSGAFSTFAPRFYRARLDR